MHAAIFGNVAAIIQKLYANRVRYHSRANEIKQFIRVHRIDQDLANRLEDYFHTTWTLSGGVDTSEVCRYCCYILEESFLVKTYSCNTLLTLIKLVQLNRVKKADNLRKKAGNYN